MLLIVLTKFGNLSQKYTHVTYSTYLTIMSHIIIKETTLQSLLADHFIVHDIKKIDKQHVILNRIYFI